MTEETPLPLRSIPEREMRDMLKRIYARNPEESFLGQISQKLLDPAKPYEMTDDGSKGRPRPHPLLISLGGIGLFVILIFLYFSFRR